MKQIYLLRHADSDWSNLNQHDFYRSLSKKGIQEASKLSNFFKNQTISVDKVFCSSSERTKQTFDMCSDGLGYPITNATFPAIITSVARLILSTRDSLQPYKLSNLLLVTESFTFIAGNGSAFCFCN